MISEKISSIREALKAASRTKTNCGKKYLSQLKEIAALRLGRTQLAASEYYRFGLYDDALYSFEEKQEFIGWRCSATVDRALNGQMWRVITADKVISYLLFKQLVLPCPKILGVYDRRRRMVPGISYLTDETDLKEFLGAAPYPLFIKPVHAGQGRGALFAVSYDCSAERLLLSGGEQLPFNELNRMMEVEAEREGGGYIFQEVVKPAPEAAALTGGKLPGVRLIIYFTGRVPVLSHAVIKFPVGRNITDNFCGGEGGNLIGRVNVASGAVEAVFGLRNGRYEEVQNHPDTRRPFRDFIIPQWERGKTWALSAASAFPGLKLQHWDMALGEQGPQFLEINGDGCLELPQIVYQRGFFDSLCREALQHATRGGPQTRCLPSAVSTRMPQAAAPLLHK